MSNTSNKNIVAQFYKEVIGARNSALIPVLVREDYIQHSPSAKDGRDGLIEMVEFLKTLPPSSETESPLKMLIADGDMVAGLLDIRFMGKRMLVVDLFRLQNGMLAEHWDATQEVAEDFVLAKVEVRHTPDALANKGVIAKMPGLNYKRIISEGDIILTQSELSVDGRAYASYDIFRITEKVVSDHLNIRQQIPAEIDGTKGCHKSTVSNTP